MKYVLDTNAISALMKGDAKILARLRRHRRSAVFVPQPAISEIAFGIQRLPLSRRRDGLLRSFQLILNEFARVPWTDEVSQAFGEIKAELEKKGTPIEDFDVAMAAHAMASKAVLVTANLGHLERVVGLRIEDWAE